MTQTLDIRDGGTLYYDEGFLTPEQADALFDFLRDHVPWKQEQGRGRPFPRLTVWYADAGLTYSYSGVTHHGTGWLPELLAVKERVEEVSGPRSTACS